jgi:GNAT superfamily N-acetyltransferase
MKNFTFINGHIEHGSKIGEYHGMVINTNTIDFINYSSSDFWRECTYILEKLYPRVSLIDIIKIKKEYRNLGFGKQLMKKIIHVSQEQGAKAIILMADLNENNTIDLVNWYTRQGFTLYHPNDQALPILLMEIA